MIAKWKLKALIQKIISFLPFKNRINFFFQRYVTKGVVLTDAHFEQKLIHAADHINYLYHHRGSLSGKQIVELGTGWYPVVPIALFLSGAGNVTSFDIYSCLSLKNKLKTIEKYLQWYEMGRLQKYLQHIEKGRLEILKEILTNKDSISNSEFDRLTHFHARVQDVRKTDIPDDKIDFICSNNTFEHIYPDVLKAILIEFKRILKPSGIMSHFIDMSDHFAHWDKSISIYNFLKYSDKEWQLLDNDIQPQNRLRLIDYIELFEKLNIKILEKVPSTGNPEDLKKIKLARQFEKYSAEELIVSHAYLILEN